MAVLLNMAFLPCTYGGDWRKVALEKTKLVLLAPPIPYGADAIARGLSPSKQTNQGFASCRAVVAPLVESAGQKSGRNMIGWIWNGRKESATNLLRL